MSDEQLIARFPASLWQGEYYNQGQGEGQLFDKLREECGVFAVYNHVDAASLTYYGLHSLQHRGEESAGIVVRDGQSRMRLYKGMGLVKEVFDSEVLASLSGAYAVGHVRYSTSGGSELINAQPLLFNYRGGELVVATNGNLVNAMAIRKELEAQGAIFQTSSDTEVIAHLMARHGGSFVEAAKAALNRLQGGFAFVLMSGDQLLVARDQHGLRPIVVGTLQQGYVFASETFALEMLGAHYLTDIGPGEIWQLDSQGIRRDNYIIPKPLQCCAMEYIYFARPDSSLQQINVHSARYRMGQQLAAEWCREADVVIGVPDSSISAAMGYAAASGLPYEMGLVKSKYSGRTFIQPSQALREKGVKMKLSALRSVIEGKRVVVIDDSLVRGTTCRRLVALLREAGATAVYVGITSPPFKYPCFYGIDTPDQAQLPASSHSVADLQALINADDLYFLSQQGLSSAIRAQQGGSGGLCLACFNGCYPVCTPDLSVTCKEPTP